MPTALMTGLKLCSQGAGANRRVFNFVTDDDTDRIAQPILLKQYRDTAIASGITFNGLIIGNPKAMNNYVETDIKTPEGFVLRTIDYASIYEAWRNKFIFDIG